MMGATETVGLLEFLISGGATGVLAFVVVGFMRGWIVPKAVHDREIARADKFEALALRSVHVSERLIDAAPRAAGRGA